MTMLTELLKVLWFLLPAGAANMAPVFAQKFFSTCDAPVDLGATLRGRRVFGSHKTWRGIAAGTIAAALAYLLQQALFSRIEWLRSLSTFDYSQHSLWLGVAMGAGALTGDLVKSAAKRQLDISPGRPWIPFDQMDWLLGTLVASEVAVRLAPAFMLTALVIGTTAHILVNIAGYLIRIRRSWI